MTWEQMLALAPLYGALAVALFKLLQQRRNGNGKNGEAGKHNPSAEYHELADKLATIDKTAAVLVERVGRLEQATDNFREWRHHIAQPLTEVFLKLEIDRKP